VKNCGEVHTMGAPRETFVRGDVAPHADGIDAFDSLPLEEPVAVSREQLPGWKIGRRRDYGNARTGADPAANVLKGSGGRRVRFRRKVVR
jgi:hypothetical protein